MNSEWKKKEGKKKKHAYLQLNPYFFENPRNGNWIENRKGKRKKKHAYLLNSLLLKKRNGIASESLDVAEDDQIFSVFIVVDHEQRFSVFSSSSISHTLGFSFFICLLVWNTLFWYECIRICTEEMEVRVSLNFRLGTFSFLLCIARFFKLQAFFLFCLSRLYIYIYIYQGLSNRVKVGSKI